MCIYVHICMDVHVYTCAHDYTYVHVYTCAHDYTYVSLYVHPYTIFMHICKSTYAYIYLFFKHNSEQ